MAFSLVISVILCAKRNASELLYILITYLYGTCNALGHKPVPVNVMCSIQTPLKEET